MATPGRGPVQQLISMPSSTGKATLTYPWDGSRTYSRYAAMLAKLLSSAAMTAPGASLGSSRRSTGMAIDQLAAPSSTGCS